MSNPLEVPIPAPTPDMSLPIYAEAAEARIQPGDVMHWSSEEDEKVNTFDADLLVRIERIEEKLNGLTDGVNTIGEMMNGVADAFAQIMAQVQKGGIGGLIGMMGGKSNG
jgi:hypothetical protein